MNTPLQSSLEDGGAGRSASLKEESLVSRIAAAMRAESGGKPFTWENAARTALFLVHDDLSKLVVTGPLQGNGCDEQAERNGIVRACNHLFLHAYYSSERSEAAPTQDTEGGK